MLPHELCIPNEPDELFRTTYHHLRHIDLAGHVAEIILVHILQGRTCGVREDLSNPYLISIDYGRVSRGRNAHSLRVIGIYLFRS